MRLAYWLGVDSREWGSLDRAAWLETIPVVQAEWELRFGDLSGRSIPQIRRLALMATGDYQQAQAVAMRVYEARLNRASD